MPTTLFVLVNAVINAFRTVDHIIVMTRGGPDNATSLLLFRVYELGFSFWDTSLRGGDDDDPAAGPRRSWRRPVRVARAAGPLSMSAPAARGPYAPTGSVALRYRVAAWMLAVAVGFAAALRRVDRIPSGRVLGPLQLLSPVTFENFAPRLGRRPFARYFFNTFLLVTLILACQLVLCTLAAYAFARADFAGSRHCLRAGAGAAHDHAGRADRRELQAP